MWSGTLACERVRPAGARVAAAALHKAAALSSCENGLAKYAGGSRGGTTRSAPGRNVAVLRVALPIAR